MSIVGGLLPMALCGRSYASRRPVGLSVEHANDGADGGRGTHGQAEAKLPGGITGVGLPVGDESADEPWKMPPLRRRQRYCIVMISAFSCASMSRPNYTLPPFVAAQRPEQIFPALEPPREMRGGSFHE